MKDQATFCCDMTALSKAERERYNRIRAKLEDSVEAVHELESGYKFALRAENIGLIEVAEWMIYERRCCPFFDLAIEAERQNGPWSLTITGPKGVKAFIRAEFRVSGLE
jgi:hypothetical protein